MIGTIRKHQNWLWAIIVTVTIASFLVFFSPQSKMNNGGGGSANLGSINGSKITPDEFSEARREIELRYLFMNGSWPNEEGKKVANFDPERETYQWLFLVNKEKQMDIHIGTEVVAQGAREMARQFEKSGITSPTMLIDRVLKPHQLDAADLERFMRHYLGIQELIATVGLSGKLVTPDEARALYKREHEELATEAVFFVTSNFLASVTAPPETVSQFYSNQLARYRVPERVQVSYVKFDVTNWLAMAEAELTKTNFNEMIEANFERLGTNYFKDAKTPEATKAKIREEMIRGRALGEARKKALEFASPLFDLNPPRPEYLAMLAATNGLTVKVSAPFDRNDPPKDMDVGIDFNKAAFSRTADEPFAGPLIGRDGVYVFAINKRLPSEILPFDQVRERVGNDYKESQAAMLARQAGAEFYRTVTNSMAQGKTFEAAAADAKAKPMQVPSFSISTRALPEVEDRISLNQFKELAFSTPAGKVSEFRPTIDGGLVVYVKARLPLDEAKMKSDLPLFVNYVRQARQNEAFNEWFRKEAEKGLRDTPLNRQQQQQQQQQQAPPGSRTARS